MLGCKIVAPIWLPVLGSNFRLPSMCEQSAVDTAKHSRLDRSYIRFRYSLFSPLTRKNSHLGSFFSVNYRLRRSVAERGIAIRDVAGWIRSKRAKRKTIRLDGFLFGSPCWARTSDIMINSHALSVESYLTSSYTPVYLRRKMSNVSIFTRLL